MRNIFIGFPSIIWLWLSWLNPSPFSKFSVCRNSYTQNNNVWAEGRRAELRPSVPWSPQWSSCFHSVWKTVMSKHYTARTIPQVLLPLQWGHVFSWVCWEGNRQSAVILSRSLGAFNLSSKKLFTVNYLDRLSSYIFHRSMSVLSLS